MNGRIVVGVDGSPQSVAALQWAAEEARLRDATLQVVTVWEFPHAAYMSSPSWMLPMELHDELLRRAKDIQANALEKALPEEDDAPPCRPTPSRACRPRSWWMFREARTCWSWAIGAPEASGDSWWGPSATS